MQIYAQSDTSSFDKKRLAIVVGVEAIGYVGTGIGLYHLWYKDYPLNSFHFFNDNNEWLQMDKCGHVITSYSVGSIGHNLLQWSGVENRKAIWYGGALGFVYQSTIEVFDGFSAEWGASSGDLISNTFGSALFISQQLVWKEQRFVPKASFHTTAYAKIRPNLLGDKLVESMLKDYNGQTYWLSMNLSSFMDAKYLPKWLCLSFGYGAEGMIVGEPDSENEHTPVLPYVRRSRQYYLSLDIDFSKVEVESQIIGTVLKTLNFIKVPFPTLEFYSNESGIVKAKLYPLYF